MKNEKEKISQISLIMEYFEANQNRDISHPEIVAWALKEYKKRTGNVFADPDRGIRSLHQKGYLMKVKNGVYKYDPSMVHEKELEDFTPALKKVILKRDNYRCAMCGKGKKEGVTLHVDHIKPKDLCGEATLENGQVLCGPHNFLKKNFKQTETGKKMFIRLYELAKFSEDKQLIKFCTEILEVFEKNGINGHIEWKK